MNRKSGLCFQIICPKKKPFTFFFFFFSYFDRWDLLNNVICIKNCVKYSKGEATKLFFNKYVTAYYVSNS